MYRNLIYQCHTTYIVPPIRFQIKSCYTISPPIIFQILSLSSLRVTYEIAWVLYDT